jgi:Cys-tRNA(Pro)/Cys-tRNA(Cys) deacylase
LAELARSDRKSVFRAIDESAFSEASVFLNGGQRGLQVELEPYEAGAALDAIVGPLTA